MEAICPSFAAPQPARTNESMPPKGVSLGALYALSGAGCPSPALATLFPTSSVMVTLQNSMVDCGLMLQHLARGRHANGDVCLYLMKQLQVLFRMEATTG